LGLGLKRPGFKAVAVKRLERLFNKNTGLCQGETPGIGADACPMPEG
jgi:hypothetical protein